MYIIAKGNSMLPTLKDGYMYKVEPVVDGRVYLNDIIVYSVPIQFGCRPSAARSRPHALLSVLSTVQTYPVLAGQYQKDSCLACR